LEDETPIATPSASWLRLGVRAGLLALAVSGLVLVLTFEESTWDHLRHLDPLTALELLGLVVAVWVCGGGRLYTLARGLGYRPPFLRSLTVTLSSEFGIAATPAGAGGAALWLGLLRSYGVPVSHGAALLTAELVVDALVFAVFLPVALWALLRQPELAEGLADRVGYLWLYPVLGAALLVAIAVLVVRLPALSLVRQWLWNRRFLRPHLVRWVRLWRQRHRFLQRFRAGLHTLFRVRPGMVALTILLALVQWTCRYSVLPLLVWRFGGGSEVLVLFLLQGLLLMLAYLIVAPGGGGGVEVAAALLLRFFAPVSAVGVIVVLWRFFTYHLFLLGGGLTFALALASERRRGRRGLQDGSSRASSTKR
jgi:uncharacterized protein (TIRG00374 family)